MPKLQGTDQGEYSQSKALGQRQDEGEGEDVLPYKTIGEIAGDGRDKDEGNHTREYDYPHPKVTQLVSYVSGHDGAGGH